MLNESVDIWAEPDNRGSNSFVAASPSMQSIERVVADIAPTDIPVLLHGESGTGKEILAQEIHRRSARASRPFVKISCAALAPESFNGRLRLAGTEVSLAQAGTVFLDEVSEIDPACQSRLLLSLVESNGHSPRLISATSRNLEEEMRAGRLREELYFRLNGVCLRLPPLRHRREDIPVLAVHFLTRYASQFRRPMPHLSAQAVHRLTDYAWPGNVRELENAMKKLAVMGDERAALADLHGTVLVPNGGGRETVSLKEASRAASREAEKQLILKVLTRTRWNRKRAAQELQISYKALLYKLKQIGVEETATA
jgi:two-component system response regulator AtoC